MIQWSAEELALMQKIDSELDQEPISMDELRESRIRDREAKCSDSKSAKYHREYYQANKEKIAERRREYYQANKEKIAERRREKRKAAQGVRAPERQWPKGPQKTNPYIV